VGDPEYYYQSIGIVTTLQRISSSDYGKDDGYFTTVWKLFIMQEYIVGVTVEGTHIALNEIVISIAVSIQGVESKEIKL